MNIKKYIVSAAMGFGLLGSVGAQASNNYAISCHGCGDMAKKSTLDVHLDSGFPEGNYNFFVIDMINTRVCLSFPLKFCSNSKLFNQGARCEA